MTVLIEMRVTGVMLDPVTSSPIVILKSSAGDRILPIWVGPFEAQAIAMRRDQITPPRPMTHDLLQSALTTLDAHVEKVIITDLRENTFYATIHLGQGERRFAIDSRPSDGIALAMRAEAPIFVAIAVLDHSGLSPADAEMKIDDSDEGMRRWLEEVDPPNKYQM